MSKFMQLLFPTKPYANGDSMFLLAMRLLFGVLLLSHGLMKISNFEAMADTFPDPMGMGSRVSLILAIFGEVVCSFAFIIGLLYRLAIIPMAFTMCVAFFVIHSADVFAVKELAFIYMVVFILMFFSGAGKYSIDYIIGTHLKSRKKQKK